MASNYKKNVPEGILDTPLNTSPYKKNTPAGELSEPEKIKKPTLVDKPPFQEPVKHFKREMKEYYQCRKDGFFSSIFGCDTKARYCSSNCICDEVCEDTACNPNCVPNCRCDTYCSDCATYCRDCDDDAFDYFFCRLDV